MIKKLSEDAVRSSDFIYTRRNKEWKNTEILVFCKVIIASLEFI